MKLFGIEDRSLTKSERDLLSLVQRYARSPATVVFSLAFAVYVAIFTPGGLLESHPFWLRFGINLLDLVIFLGISYIVIPKLYVAALRRGWPVFWTQVGSYLGLAFVLAAVFTFMEFNRLETLELLWQFVAILGLVMLAAAIGILILVAFYLPELGIRLTPRELFFFSRAPDCAMQEFLPHDMRAPILRMSSQNQYVEVTTNRGATLLRLTLAEAEEKVPEGRGLRIHRSHWVAENHIGDLFFEAGNPRIATKDGTTLPVSRTKADAVRAILARQSL